MSDLVEALAANSDYQAHMEKSRAEFDLWFSSEILPKNIKAELEEMPPEWQAAALNTARTMARQGWIARDLEIFISRREKLERAEKADGRKKNRAAMG